MRSSRRRLTLAFAEQAVSSLGSVVILVMAAQGLDADGVGYVSLAIATALVAQSFARAFVGEVLLTVHVGDEAGDDRGAGVLGALTLLTLLGAPVVALGLTWVTGSPGLGVATAVLCAGMLLQDGYRIHAIHVGVLRRLLGFTTAANVLQCLAVLGCATATGSAAWTTAAGGCAVLAVLAVLVGSGVARIDLRHGRDWIRRHHRTGAAYLVEVISGAAITYGLALLLVALVAPAAVAAYRATLSIYGATSVFINFARASLQRELSRSIGADPTYRTGRVVVLTVVGFVVGVGATFAVLRMIPEAWGVRLLGEVWPAVAALLLVGALDRLAACLSVVPTIVLRARGVTWGATRVRLAVAALGVAAAPFAIHAAGVPGAFAVDIGVFVLLTIGLSLTLDRHLTARRIDA